MPGSMSRVVVRAATCAAKSAAASGEAGEAGVVRYGGDEEERVRGEARSSSKGGQPSTTVLRE